MLLSDDDRPRVLVLELGALERGRSASASAPPRSAPPTPWRSSLAWLDRVGLWSGGALGLALHYERALAQPDAAAPLVISVGECVRRGVPTAARASLASRAPLTGLFAE